MSVVLRGIKGFEWDEGNSAKSEAKHGVTDRESEEIFFNTPLVVARSSKGGKEIRYVALWKTYGSRLLTVVFTVRANRIRVISARPMSRNERKEYEKEQIPIYCPGVFCNLCICFLFKYLSILGTNNQ